MKRVMWCAIGAAFAGSMLTAASIVTGNAALRTAGAVLSGLAVAVGLLVAFLVLVVGVDWEPPGGTGRLWYSPQCLGLIQDALDFGGAP